jgi:ABC-type transport system involved in multi-copper enzyme maturation permease subunit
MTWRWGPGPVFVIEMRAAARRWQTYALRAGFVAALLAAFFVVWWVETRFENSVSVRDLARVGERFYYGLIGTQLALLLLAAPAATAGAISEDRARGGLLHMLVTDLTDAEIVLGKLFGRLAPVLGLMACGLPVPGLVALLGGIDPEALFGAYLVTAGATILACAVALTVSVWAARPTEALLATYVIVCGLLLPYPAWRAFDAWAGLSTAPSWLVATNPFWLAFAPYLRPGRSYLGDSCWFLAITVALAAGLALLCVVRVRAVSIAQTGQPQRTRRGRKTRRGWLPGPSLDGNPVLWREWHWRQSSRRGRMIWWLYALVAAAFSVLGLFSTDNGVRAWINGLQSAVGLLLFSVAAVTSLASERASGSLDVLLTTPLTAGQVLGGKWWGTFRTVPLLLVLPLVVVTPAALRNGNPGIPVLMAAMILAYGAAFTSLGLALATWIARLARAALLSATVCVVLTVGWMMLLVLLFRAGVDMEILAMASPFFGPGNLTFHADHPPRLAHIELGAVAWSAGYLLAALLLIVATRRSFDRCLGRVRQRPKAAPGSS